MNSHISLSRLRKNRLYTEGEFLINNHRHTFTVESTDSMPPPGIYRLRLVKKNAHCRELIIAPEAPPGKHEADASPPWRIGIAHSWIDSRKKRIIAIGQPFIPGSVFKGTRDYERLIKRLEKSIRKTGALLIIDESHCHPNLPSRHWLK